MRENTFQLGNLVRLKRLPGNIDTQKFQSERFQLVGIITKCIEDKFLSVTYKVRWFGTESFRGEGWGKDLCNVNEVWYYEVLEKIEG